MDMNSKLKLDEISLAATSDGSNLIFLRYPHLMDLIESWQKTRDFY